MKKNVASQVIGAQMVAAADGSAFTGTVTCYVTGDGGTQALGANGSGVCAHEGNGFHTYGPSQAETNYDHVAFTFIGTGAVPVTIQVYTAFPQTGDGYGRLGAPAGASIAADIAALPTDADVNAACDSALADYDAPTKAEMDSAFGTTNAFIDTEVAAIKAKTDNLPDSPAATGAAMTLAADAVSAASLAADAGTEIANAVKATVVEAQGNYTLQQALSVILAVLAGQTADNGATLKTPNGAATRVTATIDENNNRTAMTLAPSA